VTNRTFLLAFVTVAALGVSAASSTPADAEPRHKCKANCAIKTILSEVPGAKQAAEKMQAAMKNQMRAAMAKQAGAMKAAMAKQMQAAMAAKQAEMEKQMKDAAAAKQAEMEKQMKDAAAAKQAEMEKQAREAAGAGAVVQPSAPSGLSQGSPPTGPAVKAKPCVTREFVDGKPITRNNCDW
jgi:hypothetical protein